MTFPTVFLQAQRHKRVINGHPWIYSNEVVMDSVAKTLSPGTLVEFRTHDKRLIGQGSFNPHCLIAGRIFSRQPIQKIDHEWLKDKIANALALRDAIIKKPFYRLIHAEADGLPGLIIDRFGSYLSVQLNTFGMELLWPTIMDVLKDLLKPTGIVLRNDSSSRGLEGLSCGIFLPYGKIPETIEVLENDITYFADIIGGQKTGWYFDQRDNHALLAQLSQSAESILDLYTHAGGFALLAARYGAKKVLGIDSSFDALALAKKAADHNGITACTFHRADVFEDLERRIIAKETYNVVIADPPAFVKSRKDIISGGRGYTKLTKLAALVTAKQGLLYIASCSHNMGLSDLADHVAKGLHEADRTGRILYTTFAAPDHPVCPNLSESSYLKGFVIKLD